jgi:hypothetical protein
MTAQRRRRERLTGTVLQLIAWPVLGFFILTFDELGPHLVSPPAGSELYAFLQWGLLTPIVVQLAFRFPWIDRPARNGAIHTVAALLLCAVRLITEPSVVVMARPPAPQYLSRVLSRDLLIYASIAVAAHLFVLTRRRSAAEREALVAQANLAVAERVLLEQTISPDLIIRSLDEIARRIREEPARVEPLIETFSEFLRSRIPAEQLERAL